MTWVITAIIVLAIVALLISMARTWRSRSRQQADLAVPLDPPSGLGEPIGEWDGFYVATTRADAPLERIVAHDWGFRGRGGIAVHDGGVVMHLTGRSDRFVPATALRGADRATWAIDRVVEPGGLVRLRWSSSGTDVDTYFRFPDGDQGALAALVTTARGTDSDNSTNDTGEQTR